MNESEKIQIIKQLLKSNDEFDKIPLRVKIEDDKKYEVIEFTSSEHSLLKDFLDFLFSNGYILDHTFESLFIYAFNLTMFLHKSVTVYDMKLETQSAKTSEDEVLKEK